MATTRTSTSTSTSRGAAAPPLLLRALIAAGVAAAVNLALLVVGRSVDASLTMEVPDPVVVEWPAVVTFSTVPVLLAGLVVWLVARRLPRARRWFAWAGLVVAVLSCVVLVSAPDVATAITLGAMHLTVGLAWWVALTARTGRP